MRNLLPTQPSRIVMNRPSKRSSVRYLAILCLALAGAGASQAGTITKANNTTTLNVAGSWTGGVVPTSGDVALWDSTVVGNKTTLIGADMSWGGIQLTNIGGVNPIMTITGTNNTLTLGASGIDMSTSTADLRLFNTATNTVVLGASQTWTVAANHILRVSGTITGTNALTIAGSGTTFMENVTNSYTGGTTLSGGAIVQVNSSGGFTQTPFGTGTLTVNNASIVGISAGNRYVANALTLNGNLTLGSSALSASNFKLGGGIDVGNGVRTISIINAAASTTSAPALAITGSGKGISGTAGGGLILANGNAGASPDVWVSMGGVAGETYSVNTDLTVGSNVTLYFTLSNVLTANCNLTVQSNGTLDLSNKGSSAINQTVQSLAGSGTVTSMRTTAVNSSLVIDGGLGTGTATFSGNIVTGTAGASIAITKQGTTTQIFSGSNNYIGQTQVNAGTLLVSGTHTDSSAVTGNGYSGAGSGHYQVASGAVLGGSGLIAGNNSTAGANMILVQSGGALAPGTGGIGTLTLDGANLSGAAARVLNMATGATFSFELAGDGSTPDRVDFWNYVSGDLLLNSNAINLTLNGSTVAGTYTVSLFRFFSDSGTTGVNSGLLSGLIIGTVGSGISGTPTLNYNAGGNTIDLTYTVVPEPSVVALAGLGLGLVLWRSRAAARRRS